MGGNPMLNMMQANPNINPMMTGQDSSMSAGQGNLMMNNMLNQYQQPGYAQTMPAAEGDQEESPEAAENEL